MAAFRIPHACGSLPVCRILAMLSQHPMPQRARPSQSHALGRECLHSQPAEVWTRLRRAHARKKQRPAPAVREADPGAWDYSPEWMGTQGGGWGRDAGKHLGVPFHLTQIVHQCLTCGHIEVNFERTSTQETSMRSRHLQMLSPE